ncbi:FecR domain-containing protein [Candidatus Peregrinibacteria bacterium]|nr:FecR domain-containing protein [Candidatus Peregrinibacteria bacterium]
MMHWLTSTKNIEKKLKQHCDSVSLSEEKAKALKGRLMAALAERMPAETFGCETLAEKIRKLSLHVMPKEYFRVVLREKLITLIEFERRRFLFRLFERKFSRRMAASFLVFLFAASAFFRFGYGIEKASASFLTTIESVVGDVSVVRGEDVIQGAPGFVLKAEDVVRTGKDSKAVIRFLDQSVSRLDENTEVKLAKLFMNPLNKTETVVELVLQQGRIWARVINLVDNISHFQVRAQNTVAVAKRKAAFDVTVLPKGKAKVAAIKNKVDLVVATDRKVVEATLINGFSAEVKSATSSASPIKQEKIQDGKDQWVKDNLEQDIAYIETVKQEVKDERRGNAGLLPGNPLYPVRELSQSTNIAFTFDEFDRHQKMIFKASEKIDTAGVLLEKGEKEKARELLVEFQNETKAVVDWLTSLEGADPEKAAYLRNKVNELLNVYEKRLTLILPDDPLYEVKSAVGQSKVIAADTAVQKTEQKLSQASDKLLEAHELVESGNSTSAADQVKAYSSAISEVASEVKQFNSDQKEQIVTTLMDNKAEALKVLQAMASGTSSVIAPLSAETPTVVDEFSPSITSAENSASFVPAPDSATYALPEPGTTSLSAEVVSDDSAAQGAEAEKQTTAANQSELMRTVKVAQNETLVKLGEAVLDVQKEQASAEVLQKLQHFEKIDLNGKPLVDVQVSKNRIQLKSSGTVISVVGSTTPVSSITPSKDVLQEVLTPSPKPPKADSKTPISPQARP